MLRAEISYSLSREFKVNVFPAKTAGVRLFPEFIQVLSSTVALLNSGGTHGKKINK